MGEKSLLAGRRILIVDDETDILETLEDSLPTCDVVKASTFDEAEMLLQTQHFDMAILDIMGVAGFKLLEIANSKKIMAVMLTAHALNPKTLVQSYREGAASYIPKERMNDIEIFLNDILEAKQKGRSTWSRWFERFGSFFEKRFGSRWPGKDKPFPN